MGKDKVLEETCARGVPVAIGATLCLGVWALTLLMLVGPLGFAGALIALLTDGAIAAAVFISAGGWGWAASRRLMPADTPHVLVAATSAAIGLWLFTTAMLVLGSAFGGLLQPYVWWPIVALGLLVAALAARRQVREFRVPRTLGLTSLLFWLTVVVTVALWIAGSTMPPGLVGRATGDFYDVVSYHLQAPREFYENGRITFLPHNTYSNFPFGCEMLFLLGMCLRGGAYGGVYVAKFTHGLWALMASVAIWAVPLNSTVFRRRAAIALLVTAPWVIYLSWLAFVELSQLAYLAIGIGWLRLWLGKPTWRSGVMIGLAAGGACATKYIGVGLVAAPLLAVLLGAAVLRAVATRGVPPRPRTPGGNGRCRPLAHVLLAAVAAMAAFSPWLIRNLVNTGNPVFPLVTGTLGKGHWAPESAERWDAGHAPAPWPQKPHHLAQAAGSERGLGLFAVVVTCAGLICVFARWSRIDPLDRACAAILLLQVSAWMLATHMAVRFLVPALVPMAIVASGFTDWLGRVSPRWLEPQRGKPSALVLFRRIGAVSILLLVVAANLVGAWRLYHKEPFAFSGETGAPVSLNGFRPDELDRISGSGGISSHLTASSLVLMVGDVRPFGFPAETLYATVWDPDPLVQILRQTREPREIIRRLQAMNVTHVWVHWAEIRRVRKTYGWWKEITRGLIDSLIAAGAKEVDLRGAGVPKSDSWPGQAAVQMLVLPKPS